MYVSAHFVGRNSNGNRFGMLPASIEAVHKRKRFSLPLVPMIQGMSIQRKIYLQMQKATLFSVHEKRTGRRIFLLFPGHTITAMRTNQLRLLVLNARAAGG